MIVRNYASRSCRRLLFTHPRRCFATELTHSEAAMEHALRERAAVEQAAPEMSAASIQEATDDATLANYRARTHIRQTTANYGTQIEPHYRPTSLLVNPPSPADVTLELLLASQAHLGHSTSLWNPANSRYIYGIREGIHIISLDVTAAHLRRAAKVVSGVAERGGIILFVGTRPGHDRCVVRAAQLAGACHLFERWTPGSITNGQQILGKCRMVVVDEFDREAAGFNDQLVEKSVLKPDLVVCLNPLENYVMLHECGLAGIPTIGIIDTDANPTWVTYPIPANDDSIRSVQVIAGVLGRAGQEGQKRRKQAALLGTVTYSVEHGLAVPTGQESQVDAEQRKIINEKRKEYAAIVQNRRPVEAPAAVAREEAREDAAMHADLGAAARAVDRVKPSEPPMGVNSANNGPQEEVDEHFDQKTSLDEAGEQVRENKL